MKVEICQDAARWDAFVEDHPDAVNYHRWTWRKAIEHTFGYRPYYLAAEQGGSICGVLPLYLIQSRLFGNSLVSVPLFTYAGVLARSVSSRDALLNAAAALASDVAAGHVELRQPGAAAFGWTDVSSKVTMTIQLAPSVEESFNRLNPKLRKRIRFARKNGLTTEWSGPEALNHFYPIFAANMRNLGTPVYPRPWFEALGECEPRNIKILTLFDDGVPTAAAFLSAYRDTLEMPWAATLPDSRKKFSPLLLYWSVVEWAHQNGFRSVDLGRCTPGSGNHDFKSHWATHERPLVWSYWLRAGSRIPAVRRESKKFRLAVEVWKRLPLFVANSVGPVVVRSLPS